MIKIPAAVVQSLVESLVEPVFGIIKEQLAARRSLLRGMANVSAEWTLLGTAFNLRTLWRVWCLGVFADLLRGPKPHSLPKPSRKQRALTGRSPITCFCPTG